LLPSSFLPGPLCRCLLLRRLLLRGFLFVFLGN
jgi:hypothetical protein